MASPGRLRDLTTRVETAAGDLLPRAPIVVALSGGADSAIAVWLAHELGHEVRAAYVHHGLPASDTMEAAAIAVARAVGVDVESHRVDPPSTSEAGLRRVRYEALLGALRPEEWLVTGHTADDQVETVLINLLRGCGLDGLAGIPSERDRIVRPLLGVSRSTTRELASLLRLPWRDDPTNRDLGVLRNRIRTRLLPHLEAEYSAAVARTLTRSAAVARSEVEELERRAARVRISLRTGGVRAFRAELAAVGPVLAARVVRRMLELLDVPYPPGPAQLAEVLAVARGEVPRTVLPGGVRVERAGVWLELARGEPDAPPEPVELVVPGSCRWGGYRLDVVMSSSPPPVPLSTWALVWGCEPAFSGRLTIRAAAATDRIPLRSGSKRVVDALAEASLPPSLRGSWPVVEIDGEVVWIPGVRRSGWPPGRYPRYLCAVVTEETEWAASRR